MFLHPLNVDGEVVLPTERAVFLVYSEANSEEEGGETNLEGNSEPESAPIELAKTSRTLRTAVAAAAAKQKPKPKVDDFDPDNMAAAIKASLMEAPPTEDIENALAAGQEDEEYAAALKASLAGH